MMTEQEFALWKQVVLAAMGQGRTAAVAAMDANTVLMYYRRHFDEEATDPSWENLPLNERARTVLRRAELHTIGQIEAALANGNLSSERGCGDSTLRQIQEVIKDWRAAHPHKRAEPSSPIPGKPSRNRIELKE